MELLRAINIELVGLGLAGLVLLQLVLEVRRHRNGSTEPPPRIVSLDGDLGGPWPEAQSPAVDGAPSDGEVARGN